jgi:hypothetical protein
MLQLVISGELVVRQAMAQKDGVQSDLGSLKTLYLCG